MSVSEKILAQRVMPVISIAELDHALPLAEALLAGGIQVMEITLRSEAALPAIGLIAERFPQVTLGAGTIIRPEQVEQASEAGAQFGVAPGLNERVVREAQAAGMLFIPGVATASEVEKALEFGCLLQKFFPATQLGGIPMLQALAGPYAHTGLQFIPLGGIKPEQAADYLALDIVGAVGGSWLANAGMMASGDWDGITRLAREASALARR